ncbi:hypothetical protein K402DRAFT_387910 [Aulographum hederae CBS 113979]|uniref:Uncharacterized protein n=1 Tax=Aulographum hederae CBS 113979 TaxID=1176131 RepID=A0A6G1HGQ5_9PEZI|nr:hypothetical protein K402DRAFT_387910 [Aulographum hederae CBS 113979]
MYRTHTATNSLSTFINTSSPAFSRLASTAVSSPNRHVGNLISKMDSIPPSEIGQNVMRHLVHHRSNPNRCACGWYIYYSSVCQHVFSQISYHCGNAARPNASHTVFCRLPAPRHIVVVRVSAICDICCRSKFVRFSTWLLWV